MTARFVVRPKHAHFSGILLALGILAFFVGTPTPSAQVRLSEEYAVSAAPYGLTHDGTNFWYSDPRSRRVYRLSPDGRSTPHYVGNIRMYGLNFNPADGMVYLGGENRVYRISPITGGVDASIPVPVKRVAGIAFGPNIWYLLEKGTGLVHYYNPQLNRNIDALRTDRKDLRDIAVHRGQLWLSDGVSGIIYRYDPEARSMTGSLTGPVSDLRGLCFTETQLWIIERRKRTAFIKRLPYAETDQFIRSGEKDFRVTVTLRFKREADMGEGHFIIPHPPNTVSQRVSGTRLKGAQPAGWTSASYTESGERVFALKLDPGPATAIAGKSFELSYEFRIRSNNVRYYVPANYRPGQEELDSSPARYFAPGSAEEFNATDPFPLTSRILRGFAGTGNSDAGALLSELRKNNLAARWTRLYRYVDESAKDSKSTDSSGSSGSSQAGLLYGTEVYLRNFGWVPIETTPGASTRESDPRSHSRDANVIEITRMPDGRARGRSMVFFVPGKSPSASRDMRAVDARVSIDVVSRDR